jgi:hypothetical protein
VVTCAQGRGLCTGRIVAVWECRWVPIRWITGGGPWPPTSKKWVFFLPRSDDASPPTGFDFVQSLVGDEVEVGSELLEQGVLGAGAGD